MAVQSYAMLGSVQALLQSSESSDGLSLAKQVSVASTLLTRSPGLFAAALDSLASVYHLLQPDQVSGAERSLAPALQEAEETVSSLLDYAPQTWSYRILQWCVDVASRVTRSRTDSAHQSLQEQLRFWLQQPKLRAILKFLHTCICHLVRSGRGKECVDVLVNECLCKNPSLNWLLAHSLSLEPASLLPPFLEQVLGLSHDSPAFPAVADTLELLAHTHQAVLGECVLEMVGRVVRGQAGQGERWGQQVELLLRLAPLCLNLLSHISQDCLRLVTAEKVKEIVVTGSTSSEGAQRSLISSGEDEGEVHSDEEGGSKTSWSRAGQRSGVEQAVVELLRALEREVAAQAISQLVETCSCLTVVAHSQEEAMEEGEISSVSLAVVVQESCWSLLGKVQLLLLSVSLTHLTPGTRGLAGSEREFVVGLQCGLQHWAHMMLQPELDEKCRGWLAAAVGCVCVCSAELQAAQVLGSMLLHCQHPHHLGYVLSVFREATLRHSRLAEGAVQAALASCTVDHTHWLCTNLWRITMETAVDEDIRSEFISALRVSVLPLTALLRRESESEEGELCGVWRVLLVLGKVGACEGQYSTLCQILGNLLTAFFCLARRTTDGGGVEAELCVGKCAALVADWVNSDSRNGSREPFKIFVLKSILKKAVNEEGVGGNSTRTEGRPSPLVSHQLTHTASRGSQQRTHSTVTSRSSEDSSQYNHLLALVELVAMGDGDLVMSVLLDEVVPHLPSDSAPWLPGDGLRSTSLEWSLSVRLKFDKYPLLWHLLLFSTHCGCGFSQCESVVCSLLLALTQHWFSCRCSGGVASGREVQSSEWLVECLAAAGWLPAALCYCSELFHSISSHDLYLLMEAISNFIKVNLEELRRGALTQLKETACWEVLKGVLLRNIHKLGNVYTHYVK